MSRVRGGTGGARRVVWGQGPPGWVIEPYHLITTPGGFSQNIVAYNISDRPQYVATVCRVGAAPPNCDADSVFALYSSVPTIADPNPFTNRATLRMEKLKNTQDTTQLFAHFFWELATGFVIDTTDTLRIVMRRPLT